MANELVFTHPNPNLTNRKLIVGIKPDQITWSYGLNTQNYPTYGGEVVQILSCYIEDMTISGTTRNYHQLERIHKYFIDYIQIASQKGSFDPRPVKMHYPHRRWTFDIHPKGLVNFTYGRDVVAPVWTIIAAVAEPDQDLKAKIMDKAMVDAVESRGEFKLFGTVTGDIGYRTNDPFRTPFIDPKKKHVKLNEQFGPQLGDYFNGLIRSYTAGNYDDLASPYSKPAGFTHQVKGSAGGNG